MATNHGTHPDSIIGRLLNAMVNRVGLVTLILIAVSAILVAGGISTAPDKEASLSPGGEVFDTGELVERTFKASTTEFIFLVEDEGGDALDAETLREWKANSDALRSSGELSDELSTYFDDDLGLTVTGTYSIADAVDAELRKTACQRASKRPRMNKSSGPWPRCFPRTGQRPASETSSLKMRKFAPHLWKVAR